MLRYLDAATTLSDLRVPPANWLEALKVDRTGQHSIGVNRRWRVCFRWEDGDASEVEIVDYHSPDYVPNSSGSEVVLSQLEHTVRHGRGAQGDEREAGKHLPQ